METGRLDKSVRLGKGSVGKVEKLGLSKKSRPRAEPEAPLFDSNYYELVPDGEYDAVFVDHRYVTTFKGSSKLFVQFRIVSEGASFGLCVYRFYNVEKINKRYRAPATGALSRDMAQLFGRRSLRSGLPFELLKTNVVRVETRTVNYDSVQKELHKENQYSVINRLIRIVT